MELRAELMPPKLNKAKVQKLAKLASAIDGGEPSLSDESIAEFNREAGTNLKYVDFQGIYGGQEQSYFLCDFCGQDSDVNLAATHQEFARWRWVKPEEFQMEWVPKFKRSVYRQVFRDFFKLDPICHGRGKHLCIPPPG